jgi:hypothetical protein
MVYDTDMHIPGQVDFFLMAFDNKNVDGIGSSLDSLLELVKDDGFQVDMKNYENDYNVKVKAIEDSAVKKLNMVKHLDEAVKVIEETHTDINMLYMSYLKIIKSYVIGYFKKVEQ